MAMAKLNIATVGAGVVTFFARPDLVGSTDEEIKSAKVGAITPERIEAVAASLREACHAFSHVEPMGRA